jgi:hypothetical protein
MHSPLSEARGDVARKDLPPAPIRYPFSVVAYPWSSLLSGRGKRTPSLPSRREGRVRGLAFAMARPRRMTRGARALLVWIPLWYAVAHVALLMWMDARWEPNRVRVEQDKWEQLHQRLAEAPGRPLVVMLGSSRTDWAFQAGRLNGLPGPDGRPLLAYNFGVPTTGPMHESLYLSDFLDRGIRPRLLLVEFVATHLNQSRRGILSEERFTIPTWLSAHQLLFLRPYLSNKRHATLDWLESRLMPWYGYRWSIHEHVQGKHSIPRPWDQARRPMDDWGCRMIFDDPNTPEFRARRWAGAFEMYGETLRRFHVGAGPLRALRDLLARCRRERIPVALVVMPVTKEFESLYNPEGRAELANVLVELRQRYQTEIIDGSDWLDIQDFDDGHHVIPSGARKFTDHMIDEVQRILARNEAEPRP